MTAVKEKYVESRDTFTISILLVTDVRTSFEFVPRILRPLPFRNSHPIGTRFRLVGFRHG